MRIEIEMEGKFVIKDYTAPAGEALTNQSIPSTEANAASGESITSHTYSDADLATRTEETLEIVEGELVYSRSVYYLERENADKIANPEKAGRPLNEMEHDKPVTYTKTVICRDEVDEVKSITVDGAPQDALLNSLQESEQDPTQDQKQASPILGSQLGDNLFNSDDPLIRKYATQTIGRR